MVEPGGASALLFRKIVIIITVNFTEVGAATGSTAQTKYLLERKLGANVARMSRAEVF